MPTDRTLDATERGWRHLAEAAEADNARLRALLDAQPPDTGEGLRESVLRGLFDKFANTPADATHCKSPHLHETAFMALLAAAHQSEPPAGIRAVFGNEKGAVVRIPDVEHRRVDDRWRAARKDDFCVGCLAPWPCKYAAHQSEPKERV